MMIIIIETMESSKGMAQMATNTEKFLKLKTGVGGNREKRQYEETFGMPREEAYCITLPNPWQRRILAELEFVLRLSREQPGLCEGILGEALDFLLAAMNREGVLGKSDVFHAEAILGPIATEARSYSLVLAGHAHLDMNWMWSWQETVAATLDTFRTMLAIMDEYPQFHFSQSQASVYKIVEDFDPEMMAQIRKRIDEGRWEVTASAWVEQDKNMPSTESMVRHILYTKKYLQEKWGVKPDSLQLDFSPDTFGHSAHLPELVRHGGVKYYYHCRGTDSSDTLYRWRAPSGQELLVYREPYWYNSGITPHIGSGLVDLAKKCGGLKTGLVVYGVGDHGGGPTRRDIERAIEMMAWPIYPAIRFGTIHEFFRAAESVRDKLNVVDHELNFIFTGCYTTQSRIKMGNRKSEAALGDAESLAGLAASLVKAPYRPMMFEKAWQGVLFTHFHDILTGSCVQDSREHAMALYSESLAVANTARANAMRMISAQMDTSIFNTGEDISQTQSEGAGAGWGIEGFSAPAASRGAGLARLFHLFNPSAHKRQGVVELTVWDWTGDLSRIAFTGCGGKPVVHQLIDVSLQQYWDHKYFRVLIDADLPSLGYATFRMTESPLDIYPFFYQPDNRTHKPMDNFIMENGLLRVEFDRASAEMVSLIERESGREYIKQGDTAGLRFVETESASSSAWKIGRYLSEKKLDCNSKCTFSGGPLRQRLDIEIPFASSVAKAVISLDKGASAVQYALNIDWHEISKGNTPVPMLAFTVPVSVPVTGYLYDVPGGIQKRAPLHHDVPGLQYGAALVGDKETGNEKALAIVSDCKYGYRGSDNRISLTLIHAPHSPDPYPERGIHNIRLAVALSESSPKVLEEAAFDLNHLPAYVTANPHGGTLPMEAPLLELDGDTGAVLSGVKGSEDGNGLIIRLYNTLGTITTAKLTFAMDISSAEVVDLLEQPVNEDTGAGFATMGNGKSCLGINSCMVVDGNALSVCIAQSSLLSLRVLLRP